MAGINEEVLNQEVPSGQFPEGFPKPPVDENGNPVAPPEGFRPPPPGGHPPMPPHGERPPRPPFGGDGFPEEAPAE